MMDEHLLKDAPIDPNDPARVKELARHVLWLLRDAAPATKDPALRAAILDGIREERDILAEIADFVGSLK